MGAIVGYEIKYYLQIIVSSLIGSYLIVRAFSIIFGGFPNEFQVYTVLSRGVNSYNVVLIMYMIAIIGIWIFGCVIQIRLRLIKLNKIVKNKEIVEFFNQAENKFK